MPRSIEGQGSVIVRYPPPEVTFLPASSTISIEIPGSGIIADPGLAAVIPGSGEIMMAPVSVCHQVSTIGALLPPITSRYQIQASGFIGSPTEPKTLIELRSYLSGISRPSFMKVRIAVGAVYKMVTLYFSTIFHQRPQSGVSGVPS